MKKSNKKYDKGRTQRLVKMGWNEIRKMSDDKLLETAKFLSSQAKQRRTKLIKGLLEENLTIPPTLQKWITTKEIPDNFSFSKAGTEKVKDVIGFNQKYDRGYANVDFSIKKDASRGMIMHKINLARRFISNETSTVQAWKKEYNSVIERLSKKSGTVIPPEEYSKFWELYNKLKYMENKPEELKQALQYGTSEEIQQAVYQFYVEGERGSNIDRLSSRLLEKMQQNYEDNYYEDEDDFSF